jgi:hypothetical protein
MRAQMRIFKRPWLYTLAATAFLFGGIGFVVWYSAQPYTLHGPRSPAGVRVEAHVHDTGVFRIDPSYWVDVELFSDKGEKVYRWRDPSGQKSSRGAKDLVDSMLWTGPTTLRFIYLDDYFEEQRATIHRMENGSWTSDVK